MHDITGTSTIPELITEIGISCFLQGREIDREEHSTQLKKQEMKHMEEKSKMEDSYSKQSKSEIVECLLKCFVSAAFDPQVVFFYYAHL